MRGRRIAFDYGDIRTGVAICDPDGILASPLCVLQTKERDFLALVADLLIEYEPVEIFIGYPVNMSGLKGYSAEKVLAFVRELEKLSPIPITLIDERLSTVSAQRQLKDAGVSLQDSKKLIDAMAAVAILEIGLTRHD